MNGILFWFCFEHQADGSTAGMTRKVNLSGLKREGTVVVVFPSSNEVCRTCSDSCFAVTVALLVRVPGFCEDTLVGSVKQHGSADDVGKRVWRHRPRR